MMFYPDKEQREMRINQINPLLNLLYKEKGVLVRKISALEHEKVILTKMNDLEEEVISNGV